MKKSLLLFSGGLDSTVLLYQLLALDHKVLCISFNYGSKHNQTEIKSAKKITKKLNIEHLVINMPLNDVLESSLTNRNKKIPTEHYLDKKQLATVVPFRNTIMLSIACGIAESRGISEIYFGANKNDYAIYRDCREDYLKKINELVKAATIKKETKIKIYAPFTKKDKKEIVSLGKFLGVNFNLTYTCYNGGKEPCGKCSSCQERIEAFQ